MYLKKILNVLLDIKAMEVLNMVGVYLTDEFRQGKSIPHLYEIVQYVSSILPRLYECFNRLLNIYYR